MPTYFINIAFTIASIYEAAQILGVLLVEKPRVVITYYYPFNIILLSFFKKLMRNYECRIICKMDWDGVIRGSSLKKLLRKIGLMVTLRFCDAIIIESWEALRNVSKELPCLTNKCCVIWNGVCDELFVTIDGKSQNRKRQILCVARVEPIKGIHDLIVAFSKIAKNHGDWRLVIVGPLWNMRYYEYLQNLVKILGLERQVTFTGIVSDTQLYQLYSESSIFALPSYLEGFSIARVEALASGLPVITTTSGGAEVVRGCGFIVSPGDIDGLADALEKLMSNEMLRAKLSEIAIKRAKELTWKKVAEKLAKIIEDLCHM
ncbi:MAG: glycosyltransferase family 4 protein [Candidatus Verstraetearchaeota archaeon]|nr:glycosyltransferase family 4 protein [Candidatus Verstraetearchaeota archaeon]